MNNWKDHQNRWVTGVGSLTFVLLIVGYGSKPIFFLFILLINFLVLKEFYDMFSHKPGPRLIGIALGLTLTGGFFAFEKPTLIAAMAGIGFCLCLFSILTFQKPKDINSDLEKHLTGIFVVERYILQMKKYQVSFSFLEFQQAYNIPDGCTSHRSGTGRGCSQGRC